VDKVIYDMPPGDFQRHFGEFQVSRAFFKEASLQKIQSPDEK
jgi:hypothetical protein